jgi:hypothetical protein
MPDEQEVAGLENRIRGVLSPLSNGADLAKTLEEMFDVISDTSGCESVGIRWRAGEDYPYWVTRGFGREFVAAEGPLCVRDAVGNIARYADGRPRLACMCGAVIEGQTDPSEPFFTDGGSFFTNGTSELAQEAPPSLLRFSPRMYCNVAGYESVALIPLRASGESFGLLQLNSRTPGRFSREQIRRYEQIAAELALPFAQQLGGHAKQ